VSFGSVGHVDWPSALHRCRAVVSCRRALSAGRWACVRPATL